MDRSFDWVICWFRYIHSCQYAPFSTTVHLLQRRSMHWWLASLLITLGSVYCSFFLCFFYCICIDGLLLVIALSYICGCIMSIYFNSMHSSIVLLRVIVNLSNPYTFIFCFRFMMCNFFPFLLFNSSRLFSLLLFVLLITVHMCVDHFKKYVVSSLFFHELRPAPFT